jgi:hypothetical protein
MASQVDNKVDPLDYRSPLLSTMTIRVASSSMRIKCLVIAPRTSIFGTISSKIRDRNS